MVDTVDRFLSAFERLIKKNAELIGRPLDTEVSDVLQQFLKALEFRSKLMNFLRSLSTFTNSTKPAEPGAASMDDCRKTGRKRNRIHWEFWDSIGYHLPVNNGSPSA